MSDILWPIAATVVGLAACFVAWDSWRRQFLADTSALAVRVTCAEIGIKALESKDETRREDIRRLYELVGSVSESSVNKAAELQRTIEEIRERAKKALEASGTLGKSLIEASSRIDRLDYEAKEEVRKLYERIGVVHRDLATFSEKTMQEFARQGGKASMNQVAASLQVAAGDGRAPF